MNNDTNVDMKYLNDYFKRVDYPVFEGAGNPRRSLGSIKKDMPYGGLTERLWDYYDVAEQNKILRDVAEILGYDSFERNLGYGNTTSVLDPKNIKNMFSPYAGGGRI